MSTPTGTTPRTFPVPIGIRTPEKLWTAVRGSGGSVLLENRGTFTVYIGNGFVTTASGRPLTPLSNMSVASDQDWYGIADAAATAKQPVYVVPGGQYAIAGTQEVANVVAAALASGGVPIIESQTLLSSAALVNLNTGVTDTTSSFDITRYQSLVLYVLWETTNQFEYLRVDIYQTDIAGNIISSDRAFINPKSGAPGPLRCEIRVPCRGVQTSLQFTNVLSAGALHQYSYSLCGSFRPCDKMHATEFWTGQTAANQTYGNDGDLLSLVTTVTVLTNWPMALHWGAAYISVANGGGATVNCSFQIYDPLLSQIVFGTANLGAGASVNANLQLANRAYKFRASPMAAGTVAPIVFINAIND